ncbi:hypothetical protein MIND_00173200 [Mycena indigotica]|uniref:Mitochondrial glyco protein n=1 Tax=Mycena indigotica TaxID=2126181 RepID=A0A8H6WL82_9AGAR|nr:uncharacterized protein MIND_00173200 [Mycena indigotica]KAF7316539.1 hypothetical protein MIND_00173200 [Mycena indigotica]
MFASTTVRAISRTLRPLSARAIAAIRPTAARTFVSSARRFEATAVSQQLLEKLHQELNHEISTSETGTEGQPEFLTAFKQQGVWEINDVPGNDEVLLTRKFGNETIRVMFSVADLHDYEEDDMESQANEQGEEEEPPIELRVSVSITKTSAPGALSVDLYCAEGAFHTANITFYKSSKMSTELTMESDFARRTLYSGPPFETLDVTLQGNFEAFLQERGLDSSLAEFVAEYAQFKEQEEYVEWLDSVGKFVES